MRTVNACFNLVLALGLIFCLGSPPLSRAAEAPAKPTSTSTAPTDTGAAADESKVKAKQETEKTKKAKEKKKKTLKFIRVHVETRRDLPERTVTAKLNSDPTFQIPVDKLPLLTESHLKRAAIIEEPGGFLIQLHFDSMGTKLLEGQTAATNGRHFAIICDLDTESRWIAIPLIRRRLADGILSFSPDAPREDMDRLVRDLNKEIDRKRKQWLD